VRCALLLVASACGVSDRPDPLPLDIEVTAVGTTTVSLDTLRLAVLYRGMESLVITNDVAFTSTTTPIALTLEAPELTDPAATSQLFIFMNERLSVSTAELVTYLDRDASNSFDPTVDVVMGLSDVFLAIAWIFELELQLSTISLEATNAYYNATGDRYTDLMLVQFAGPGAYLVTEPSPISVEISRMSIAAAELTCGRAALTFDERSSVRLTIDEALDLGPFCDIGIGTCESADVAALPPVDLTRTSSQCVQRGALESLALETVDLSCDTEDCHCTTTRSVRAIITSTTSVPAWWPCGEEIEYCASSLPLYQIDPACFDD
jgi:hypothetical protein